MSDLALTHHDVTLEFTVTTTDKVVSFGGTEFVPNHCDAKASHGKILFVNLSQLDEYGYGVDDPAGPDGAELNVSYGGGQLEGDAVTSLPEVAREALTAIKWALR
jgi:hypothetical protein